MAEIVNLRRVRKLKARAEHERTAEANRLKFGQPKAEKEHKQLEDARSRRVHDAHKRDEEKKYPSPRK